jgi:hypothetical protein
MSGAIAFLVRCIGSMYFDAKPQGHLVIYAPRSKMEERFSSTELNVAASLD